MTYPVQINIPNQLDARITPNSRSHWRTKHKIQKEMKHTTQMAMMAAGPHASLHNATLPLTLNYIIGLGYKRREMDKDNIISSLKYVQDGIAAYLGINDKHFEVGTIQQVRDSDKTGFIRVLISGADNE